MATKTRKAVIGFTVGRVEGREHKHLHITLHRLYRTDLVKEMQGWLHNEEQVARIVRQANYANDVSGERVVYRGNFSRESLNVIWMHYRYNAESEPEWIAPRIEGYLDTDSLELVKAVHRRFSETGRPKELSPAQFLQGLGATPMKWHNECDGYLPCPWDEERIKP